ncbi:MAG: prolipoprotein diacylglyceryl transferase [Bacteroidia bacterium]
MTFPVEIGFGAIRINAHLVFEILAFMIGYRYFVFLRKGVQDPISSQNRVWIIIGAALGAFLGSRLLGALEHPQAWLSAAHPFFYFFANKTIVGALLGGLFGVEMCKKLIGESESSGDLFTFPLILGMMIGRIGCFLNGVYEQTYGLPTASPFGMDLGDGMSRHPVALYEIGFLVLLWLGLRWVKKRHELSSGQLFQLFMVSYLLFRFGLDFIKPGYRFLFGLGSIQIACLIGLGYYWRVLISWFR